MTDIKTSWREIGQPAATVKYDDCLRNDRERERRRLLSNLLRCAPRVRSEFHGNKLNVAIGGKGIYYFIVKTIITLEFSVTLTGLRSSKRPDNR